MSSAPVQLPKRRSLLVFAILAMGMVVLSYVFTLFLAAACVYFPWLVVSNVNNAQALALFLGGIVIAGVILWSLIPRPDRFEAPGLLLEPGSHPRLFIEIENISRALQQRLPREVYLLGDANAWVADRGGFLGFGSRRVMGLGLPLLAALNVSEFRAVLAHECAHYYGGDTSLGPWVYRAQMAMIRTFRGIGAIGEHKLPGAVAVLFTIVFAILKWYWLVFLRAINFVSRRQEFRADELACVLNGSKWLTSGLRAVHGTSLAWPTYWQTEVVPILNQGFIPSIGAGFSQFLAAPVIATQVQSGIETEIREGKPDPYDSHPSLKDRLGAAEGLPFPAQPEDRNTALTLLDNPELEEVRFLEAMNPDMPRNSLRPVRWEEQAGKVLIPSWQKAVAEYASLLHGISVETLPATLGNVRQMAREIRDPKGRLLSPDQRADHVRFLLGAALALTLIDNGWTLHASPGEFRISRGAETVNPYELIQQLSAGVISADAWPARCRELGIAGVPFVVPMKS
jgi:Zn-dependent protease with chaperone function